ncbi:MAG: PEP-CTERM sorting domain-containing protein [Planctomycetota bacterium]
MVAPAAAMPSLSWVDNTGSATLQVTTPDTGSLAVEILIDADMTISNPVVNASIFDTPNPGNNSLTGGETTGLYDTDIASGDLFLSFGSDVVTPGSYDLLTIDYSGSGDIDASGLVAQLGVNTAGLLETLTIAGGDIDGDTNGDGLVDATDLAAIGLNWDPTGANGPYTRLQGDLVDDELIDASDLAEVGLNWNPTGAAVAVPEPTSLLMVFGGLLVGLSSRRK